MILLLKKIYERLVNHNKLLKYTHYIIKEVSLIMITMSGNNWNKSKMKYNNDYKLKYLLSILIILIVVNSTNAQLELESFIDTGENNVSEGAFIKNAYRGNYQYKKYNIETGIQFDLMSSNPNTLTGVDIIGSRKFLIKKFFL
mgnify:FL=1